MKDLIEVVKNDGSHTFLHITHVKYATHVHYLVDCSPTSMETTLDSFVSTRYGAAEHNPLFDKRNCLNFIWIITIDGCPFYSIVRNYVFMIFDKKTIIKDNY